MQVQQVQLPPGVHQATHHEEAPCRRLLPPEKVRTHLSTCPPVHLPPDRLARFEHSSRLHKKIVTRVDFPEIVDMSPYISHSRSDRTSYGFFFFISFDKKYFIKFIFFANTANISPFHATALPIMPAQLGHVVLQEPGRGRGGGVPERQAGQQVGHILATSPQHLTT